MESVRVSPGGHKMTVGHSVPPETIVRAVEAIGYEAISHQALPDEGRGLWGWLRRS